MNALIIGCGRVGAALALRLQDEGHSVVVIDQNLSAFNRLGEGFRGKMVVGNGLEEGTLVRAGIESADCFASVTNGDNRNLMMAQMAKHIFGVKRVITRLHDPLRAEVYGELGLETFCSTAIGCGIITEYFDTGRNRGPQLTTELARVRARFTR